MRPGAWLKHGGWGLVLALLLAASSSIGTWRYPFIDYDDPRTIVQHELVSGLGTRPLLDYVRPERSGGLGEYMPLKTLSLAIDHALFGAEPSAYRGQQLLWHALCVLGVWCWSRRFLQRAGAPQEQSAELAGVACLLFVLHPAHVESVTWLSGRKDVMCGAFMLAALTLALRPRAGSALCALACSLGAMLSKPIGIVLMPCFLAQDLVFDAREAPRAWLRRRAAFYLLLGMSIAAFIAVYLHVAGDGGESIRPEASSRIYRGPSWFRMLQQLGLFVRYALLPFGMSPEMPVSVLGSLGDARGWLLALVGVLLLTAAGLGCWRRQPWAVLLVLFIAPIAPIVLRPPWAQYIAGRYLFLSIAPLALGLCFSAHQLTLRAPRLKVPLHATLAAVLVAWGLEHWAYEGSFRDSTTLWAQASAQFPDSAELAFHAAKAASNAGQTQLADRYYERCIALEPLHPQCAAQLGTTLLTRDVARAELLLTAALPHDETGVAHRSLAYLLAARGKPREGATLYQKWLASHHVNADGVRPMIGLALASHDRELTHKALRKVVQVMVLETPATPPPLDLFERTAERLEEPQLAQAARDAASACQRTDCFARRLYALERTRL